MACNEASSVRQLPATRPRQYLNCLQRGLVSSPKDHLLFPQVLQNLPGERRHVCVSRVLALTNPKSAHKGTRLLFPWDDLETSLHALHERIGCLFLKSIPKDSGESCIGLSDSRSMGGRNYDTTEAPLRLPCNTLTLRRMNANQ
jgi:hypothetical protein